MGIAALLRALRDERLAQSGAKADDRVLISWFQDVRALRNDKNSSRRARWSWLALMAPMTRNDTRVNADGI